MPDFQLEPIRNDLNRRIRGLQPELQRQLYKAIRTILNSPKSHPNVAKIKHLVRGKYNCKWESKEIYGWRIVYSIDDKNKIITLFDVTKHVDGIR